MESFTDIAELPDELLKQGIYRIQSALLQLALSEESDEFVDRFLRVMKSTMKAEVKADIVASRGKTNYHAENAEMAQEKVLKLFKRYLDKKNAA